MNERIKELAEQAGFNHMGIGLVIGIEEYHQKFAELIVAECAMFVVTELEGKVGSRIADATANRLEEHFGVG
jgi:hypothetical protein